MKILCLIDSWGKGGGAQRQMAGLCSMLSNQYHVKVLSYWDDHFWDDYLREQGLDFFTITNAKNFISKFYHVYLYLKGYAPDVVVAYLNSPSVIACLIRIIVGKRFYLIVSERNTTQNLTVREKIRFFLFRWADRIVPNSYTQERFIKRHYPHLLDKIVTITNFTDMDYFVPDNSCKKSDLILNVLIVARIVEQKNVLNFIDAINILKNKGYKLQVKWFGSPNPKEYYMKCINRIQGYDLSDTFHFRESTINILQEYQKSDVFCLPSIFEGYPNVVCEAMSCGLPVLCSNVCDNPDIVEDGKNGFLFSPFAIEDIVDKFMRFISLSEFARKEMGVRSRAIAETKFSKERFIQEYMELIEKAN
jgi:glycosyltransferase involved in cell wall biosynthesis